MRGRVAIALAAAAVVACVTSAPLLAAPGDSTSTDTNEDTGTIIPTAQTVRSSGSGGTGGPTCQWTSLETTGYYRPGADGNEVLIEGTRETSSGTEVLYTKRCNGVLGLVWVPPTDPAELREDAYRTIERQLPLPETNISPDPSTGAYVNFGLWLAVDDPGPISATAAVGPVWVTITAAYGVSTWDMGTGEPFDCIGLGTPIVDPDTSEQGPCGFTYDKPSAPKFTGAQLAYKASVTGTWTITWVDYTGATGGMDPLQRTTPFDYRVREIQTVGVADQ